MRKCGICYCYGMCALFQAILEITLLVLWIRLYKHFVINTGDFTFQPLEPLEPLDPLDPLEPFEPFEPFEPLGAVVVVELCTSPVSLQTQEVQ